MPEELIPKIIKKVLPAVVSITISKNNLNEQKKSSFSILNNTKKNYSKISKKLIDLKKEIPPETGSGFIVDKNGLILTNKHIVLKDQDTEYTVITNDEKKYQAQVLSRDPLTDVAILKIEAKNLPIIPLGDSSKLELGQTVIAIGNVLGIFKNTISKGIISGLSRSIYAPRSKTLPAEQLRGLIQTDAAINPGNSGGPLIDLSGRAIGINTAIVIGAENIGFAIPINLAKKDLEDIKKYGKIKKPFLGIRYLTIDDRLKAKFDLPFNYGALIVSDSIHEESVIPNSPAQIAGLKDKDIILECNSQKISPNYSISDILEEKDIGDELNFSVFRKNKIFHIKVKLAERK